MQKSLHLLLELVHLVVQFSYFWPSHIGGQKVTLQVCRKNYWPPYKEIMPLSTASTASSNDSIDRLPLGFVASTLFVLVDLCIVFDIV